MNFLSAEDMSVVLAMQLHKSVGLGMTANMHLTRMHVEGKASLLVSTIILSLIKRLATWFSGYYMEKMYKTSKYTCIAEFFCSLKITHFFIIPLAQNWLRLPVFPYSTQTQHLDLLCSVEEWNGHFSPWWRLACSVAALQSEWKQILFLHLQVDCQY